MSAATTHLYEKIADEVTSAIRRGSLRPGDRLPSVRLMGEQRRVSVATVLEAYRRLEDDGLIETRPKSGHFVRRQRALVLEEPRAQRPSRAPTRVSVGDGVSTLLATMRDPSVVPLGAAYPAAELLPIASLNRMLAQIAREVTTAGATYEAPPGVLTLRRQLARRSLTWGVSISEDEFVITSGAMEGLHTCLRAVTRSGDTVAVETPMYFGILQLVEEMGLRAIEIPSLPRVGMDLDVLEDALRTQKIHAIVSVANVNNPIGSIMPDEAKERLVKMLSRHDVPLIEDDIYGDLAFEGRPRPIKAFDREGRVLLCGSVSKTLAPGYRVGWVSGGRFHDRVARLKYTASVASATLPQMAVAEFLESGGYDKHLRRLRARCAAQSSRVREAVATYFPAGTRVSCPLGGFVLWVEMPPGVLALDLQSRALQRGIAIAPGPIFSARGRFQNAIRLSCGLPWSERVDDALRVLGELVDEQLGPSRTRRSA